MRRLKTVRRPPIYPKTPGHLPCSSLTHPLPLSSRRPSVSFGGFGLIDNGIDVPDPDFSDEARKGMKPLVENLKGANSRVQQSIDLCVELVFGAGKSGK